MNQGGSNRSMHADNVEGQGHLQEQHQQPNEGQNIPDPAPAPAPMVNPFANITPETWEALQAFAGLLRANEKRDTDVKINDPEIFDGSTSKARAFLQDCELAFVINPHKFKEDRYKIGYILSFMKHGMAREFATYWHGYVEDKGWPLYSEFKEAFIKHFYATDRSAQAFAELRNHRMTGTADKYITRFQTLVHEAGIKDPVALQGYFLQGLSAEMLKNLAKESRAIPNYPEVVEIVRTLDHNKRLISNVSSLGGIATSMNRPPGPRPFGNNQGQPFRNSNPPPNYAAFRKPGSNGTELYPGEPMDIDAVSTPQANRPQGNCFNCNQPGHIARNCRAPRPNTTNGPISGTWRFFPKNRSFQVNQGNNGGNRPFASRNPYRNASPREPAKPLAQRISVTETGVQGTAQVRALKVAALMQNLDSEAKEELIRITEAQEDFM